MRIDEKVLLIMKYTSNNNIVEGKTLLQKTIYFVNEQLNLGISFSPYYYGPYSSLVTSAIEEMKQVGAIEEEVERFPFDPFIQNYEPKLYKYTINEFGNRLFSITESKHKNDAKEISNAVNEIKEASKKDYKVLSIAGKMYNILKSVKKKMTAGDIIKEAKFLGWDISDEDARLAIKFLKDLGLIKTGNSWILLFV